MRRVLAAHSFLEMLPREPSFSAADVKQVPTQFPAPWIQTVIFRGNRQLAKHLAGAMTSNDDEKNGGMDG
jgi:hypothetical protein